MIAVTGASGQLGRLVIAALLERTSASNIIALVRNPDKVADLAAQGVQVRVADYDRPDTLSPALEGVRRLLLISGSEVGRRLPQHQAVIDAAAAAGLELFVYTSLLQAAESPMLLAEEHRLTEAAIAAAGLPAVILRNGWYTENLLASLEHEVSGGKVFGAAGEGRFSAATRQDYAEAAAAVLTGQADQAGQVLELGGDSGFTMKEYAEALSRAANTTIVYQNLPTDAYSQLLTDAGLPEGFAAALTDSQVQAGHGWLSDDSGTLRRLIGRPTTPLNEALAAALA